MSHVCRMTTDDLETTYLDVLWHIFDCQLSSLFLGVVRDSFLKTPVHSTSVGTYAKCLRGLHGNILHSRKKCLPILMDQCNVSDSRVIKVIRLSMRSIERLLQQDPTIRVLYYTRDPRPVILSRLEINKQRNVTKEAVDLCGAMERDLTQFNLLLKKYPQNLIRLTYEKLVLQPQATAEWLYQRLQLKIPSALSHWITTNTKANESNSMYGTRRNSQSTMEKWVRTITNDQKKHIDSKCGKIIKLLNLTDMYHPSNKHSPQTTKARHQKH